MLLPRLTQSKTSTPKVTASHKRDGVMRDTIIGLTAVLRPTFPQTKTLVVLVVGFFIGLIWAYAISPTVFYDADPSQLDQTWQNVWVNLLADRYANRNAPIEDEVRNLLRAVDDPEGIVRLQGIGVDGFSQLAIEAMPGTPAPQPNIISTILPWILGPILLVVLTFILTVIWGLLIFPLVEPYTRRITRRTHGPASVSDLRAQAEIQGIRDRRAAEATQRVDYAASTLGTPVIQKMSVYTLGFGQYDDSFAIEDANNNDMFLGECGATVSETIGVGDPPKATAIEAWLFDKEDFVRTITKLFVSEHAYNDPGLRASLELKGELVLAQPGAVAILETNTLRLQARIVDMEYGTGPLPPKSYFEKMTVEMAVWQIDASSAPAAAPAMMSAPPSSGFAAPAPVAPAAAAPSAAPLAPPSSGFTLPGQAAPLQPPPPMRPAVSSPLPPRPRPPDDDPFGGTGDFTPVS
jgi:hypothetical protein